MNSYEKFFENKPTNIVVAILSFLILCLAYSTHFTNGFQFDDFPSIVNNGYIHDISNLPLFFTDIKYFGTNVDNLGYRPIVASLNAISIWVGGGLNPVYFHSFMFFWYLLQLTLMFVVFRKIFIYAAGSDVNTSYLTLTAILSVTFYGVHAANAETINYLISISDSFSTLCIVASLLLYMIPVTKKYYLYLLTLVLAIGTKETAVMFGPILFIYILLFEENVSLIELTTFKKGKNVFNAFKKAFPALLVSFGLFYLIRKLFIPDSLGIEANTDSNEVWQYFYSQWFVIIHYLGNFVLPLDLSADPDIKLFQTILDRKVLLSLSLLLIIIAIGFFTSTKKEMRPISFGIMWFFIALAPTSSLMPLSQVVNDHRTFFPYIGLVMSVGWYVYIIIKKYKFYIIKSKIVSSCISIAIFLILSLQAYGTYQRCNTWGSNEALWHDAAIKGPNNGRAQLNYGLTLMAKGNYDNALIYLNRAIEIHPNWAYSNLNMGVLKAAMGKSKEAEIYFKKAIFVQPNVPAGYYFYARWLNKNGRVDEAITQLQIGNKISPGHTLTTTLLNSIQSENGKTAAIRIESMENTVKLNPSSENYIKLSLIYYENNMFLECIDASQKSVQIEPNNSIAYNNMCSAYCGLKEWQKAADACSKALEIDPNFQRATNNLNWAKGNIK